MSGHEQRGGSLVVLAAIVAVGLVLAWALWPYLQRVLDGFRVVGS